MPEYKVAFTDDGTTSWSQAEQDAIMEGVARTGQALQLLLSEMGQPVGSPQEAFNQVIVDQNNGFDGYVLFIKTTSSTTLTIPNPRFPTDPSKNINVGNQSLYIGAACLSQIGDPSNDIPQIIACNNFSNDPYPAQTTVHELGHILDYGHKDEDATDDGYLTKRMQTTSSGTPLTLRSCPSSTEVGQGGNRFTIFGLLGTTWRRGSTGWGSQHDIKGEFVRNPDRTPIETTADMFLNWVYHKAPTGNQDGSTEVTLQTVSTNIEVNAGCTNLNDQNDLNEPTVPQNWDGFQNIAWASASDEFEWGLPGDVRFVYMDEVIRHLINIRGE